MSLIGSENDNVGFVTLKQVLGKPGEQGEVWLAHANDYQVLNFAIKIAKTPISSLEDPAYKNFQNEFLMLASLKHPNIVRVFSCGTFEKASHEYPYYIMEHLGNHVETLQDAFHKCPPEKRIKLFLRTLLDTASALRHVHLEVKPEACHRDIKGSNILIRNSQSENVSAILIDFGFSLLLQSSSINDAAGRDATKHSSIHHPDGCKTVQHLDIWQFAHVMKRYLDEAKSFNGVVDKADWPIDYADLDRVDELLTNWESIGSGNPAQNGDIRAFYDEIDEVRSHGSAVGLSSDVRGASRYFAIPELTTAARIEPAFQAVRIPPRQLVLYTERIVDLITSPQFGVLRYTRQLGFTHLVYPGAQGTRFEHSLGVYDLACVFIIRMSGHAAFRRACGNPRDALKFILACLLHDIGHYPFAHQVEEFDNDDFSQGAWNVVQDLVDGHHRNGELLIKRGLLPLLKDHFSLTDDDINDIALLIYNSDSDALSPALGFLHQLLDGPVDLDKLDYIERDAHHCGVPYGNFLDMDRILETMRVVEDKGTKRALLAFDKRGLGCLEQLATARHQMYANVYWHRAVRSATSMFKHAFYLFAELFPDDSKVNMRNLFLEIGSDDSVLQAMSKELFALNPTDYETRARRTAALALLRSVSGKERILYKPVLQEDNDDSNKKRYGGYYYPGQRPKAKVIYELLKAKGCFINEVDESGGEHNVLIDCRIDSWPDFENVQIIDERGKIGSFIDYSPSIEKLRADFVKQACKIRVFVNPRVLKKEWQSKDGRAKIGDLIKKDKLEVSRRG